MIQGRTRPIRPMGAEDQAHALGYKNTTSMFAQGAPIVQNVVDLGTISVGTGTVCLWGTFTGLLLWGQT